MYTHTHIYIYTCVCVCVYIHIRICSYTYTNKLTPNVCLHRPRGLVAEVAFVCRYVLLLIYIHI